MYTGVDTNIFDHGPPGPAAFESCGPGGKIVGPGIPAPKFFRVIEIPSYFVCAFLDHIASWTT